MEQFSQLRIGWLNGWILLAFEFLIQGGLLLVFPKDVVTRLFARSGWNQKQRIFTIAGKLFSLACLILIFLTPLKINSTTFIVGLFLYTLGLAGLIVSMFTFKNTLPGQPVVKGIYKLSRHPQIVSLNILFLGICLAIGSWLALLALIISRLLQHFGILGEEEVCLRQYGESYRAYIQQVPRYFLFF